MALTIEWQRRIDRWREELSRHVYRPLGPVELEGFKTNQQLSLAEALKQEFKPMPPGTAWGAKWEYGWFRGRIVLPEQAAGHRIVLRADVGGESAIFINGVAAGARDHFHTEITLTQNARPGEQYDVLIEAYAGHGPQVVTAGPCPPGRATVPDPGPTQTVVGRTTFGIWEEEAYQLHMDVETLYALRNSLDPNSLRVSEIDQALRDFTTLVDLELPYAERMETMRAGRERLKPLLQCVNGTTAPLMFMFGHSHIDAAWLWPLAETDRKCLRTFSSQLALMAEYPEYKFLQSEAYLYQRVKTLYPELYARIQQAARDGQFLPEGGTWIEPDTNITSGESLIRQFIHGMRFFQEEFGVRCEILWLPDVFGYSGNLPQILRGCDIRYFSTAKIFWNYNGGDPFPLNTFVWEGIDGSEVLVHLCNDYNSQTDPATVIERWNQRVQKDGISTRLFPFGWGDGGGGPTRDHLEYIRRESDLEGVPRTRIAAPNAYFHDLEARGIPNARYVGELYFQAHRGTYTSQARTKRGNRKSELALREAELWGVAANVLAQPYRYPLALMDQAWKDVLLNQFHDILPGSSIHRVYEEAEAAYARVIDTAEEVAGSAAARLTDDSEALTVFNSLGWERRDLVALPEDYTGAVDLSGNALPIQVIEGEPFAEVTIPACGWTTLRPPTPAARVRLSDSAASAGERWLENEHLRVEFNERGEITSLFDKELGRELTAGLCNSLKMYKDVPTCWDAWDIDSMYALTPVPLEEPATFEVIASGPLVATLRVTRRLHESQMVQDISLRRDSRRVDFETELDWQESHKLLKVAFPVDIHANEGVEEIQFGHIRRPNHLSRPFDADRFEVAQQKWTALMEENRGVAVLNDCKYGVNVLGNSINLTLLKSALAPDMTADRGRQVFTYSVYAWNGPFADSPVVREAYELNVPTMTVSGAAGQRSLFSVDAPNIILETIKPAEDGSDDVIVRLYECKRMATRCNLVTSLPIMGAVQTNMLEEGNEPLIWTDEGIPLDFRPFEIKTIRLHPVVTREV